jgi:hypothetical protein
MCRKPPWRNAWLTNMEKGWRAKMGSAPRSRPDQKAPTM